jgi:hypothetical protein
MLRLIHNETYCQGFLIGAGCRWETFVNRLTSLGCDLTDDKEPEVGTNGRCYEFKEGQIAVWVREAPATPEATAILVHELYHAVRYALDRRGVADEEAQAYLLQELVRRALK